MKCILEGCNVIIYIPKKEEIADFENRNEIENYFKKLFLKIKDNYQICMNGFYNVDIYLDSIYGIILELKEEKLEFIEYYEDEIDMRISIHEDEFLYQIDDILKINRDNYDIYNYQNKWYIKLKNENKKNLYSMLEHVNVIYKEIKPILKYGKKL